MFRRPHCLAVTSTVSAWCSVQSATRGYHLPGWKTMSSTKDARSREQREADRKARQIEKLPRPEALHDFQYPYEKTVLSDYMFQYPVYENELDTPHLFNLTPPPNFFLYWNATDFERTAYPSPPELDHRLLIPSRASAAWSEHERVALQYFRKHQIVPNYIPQVNMDVNLSVVFPGKYRTRAQKDDPPAAPETDLTRRNFWFTAHCGNYIELSDLQQPPSVFFWEDKEAAEATTPALYTLMILSPDYPYRVPSYLDSADSQRGFFLNYMVANLPGGPVSGVTGDAVAEANGQAKAGDVVVPYVPPLPTEDAGTTRHLCVLFRQAAKIDVKPLTIAQEQAHFPLAERSRFRLHDPARESGSDLPACLSSLRAVERSIGADPCGLTFFQTKWDIQVQEFYERVDLPEPAAPADEEIEALLEFHALSPEQLRVRARHRPDGSTNMGDDPNFWAQTGPTRMLDGSMQSLWSKRTSLTSSGEKQVYPRA